ncbi:MAG: oxidoreductase, partial [Mycobacterium sp.]
MRLFDRYRQTPPSASGRTRHDVTLSLAEAALSGIWAASAAVRRIRPPGSGGDTIALRVERRRGV